MSVGVPRLCEARGGGALHGALAGGSGSKLGARGGSEAGRGVQCQIAESRISADVRRGQTGTCMSRRRSTMTDLTGEPASTLTAPLSASRRSIHTSQRALASVRFKASLYPERAIAFTPDGRTNYLVHRYKEMRKKKSPSYTKRGLQRNAKEPPIQTVDIQAGPV